MKDCSRVPLWMGRSLLVLAFTAVSFLSQSAAAYDVEDLQVTGPSSNRLDLLIMGDGYTSGQQAKMTTDAQAVMNAFWSDQFFGAYKDYFNVRLVHVVSNQSGADWGSEGVEKDTALGSYFNCANVDRLLCFNSNAVNTIAMADAPGSDQILVMVNDTKYGGAGGGIASTSIAPSAVEVPIHELGHSLFGLADEYTSAYIVHDGECSEVNVTRNGNVSTVKWNYWADLPQVDVFLGAHYETSNHYRPIDNCKMRTLGVDFGPICREKAVLSVYDYATLVDGKSPAAAVVMDLSDTQEFEVQGVAPIPTTVHLSWLVDGTEITSGSSRKQLFSGSDFGPGMHTLEVFLQDTTSWVRMDPGEKLQASVSFSVQVNEPPPSVGGAPSVGGSGSGGAGGSGGTGTGATAGGVGTGGGTGGELVAGAGGTGVGEAPLDPSDTDPSLDPICACRAAGGTRGNGVAWLAPFVLALGAARRRRTIVS